MVETREGVKQPFRKTCVRVKKLKKLREVRNLLNLHWTFLFEDFRQTLDHILPRPDSSNLHHPPPSPTNCGTAETGEIFRAVGAVLQDQASPETP